MLGGIHLAVPAGSAVALVGPNGSGKSTLLRLLAGVDRPGGGRIRVLGGAPSDARVRARVAFLPEESPFPVELSALAVLDLLAALAGRARGALRPRALELLERVGLSGVARRPLRTYSRGMLRRFGLAQAFLTEPEVLLLDEPTAGLDAPGFAVLEDLLAEAQGRGATVVLSSHLVSDAFGRCERWVVLVDGRIAATGEPRDLVDPGGGIAVDVEGLGDAGLAALGDWIESQGGRLVGVRPSSACLGGLYLRGRREEEGARA